MIRKLHSVLPVLAFLGILDAGYLSYEHFFQLMPPCSTNLLFLDCGKVLSSPYSILFGIPLAYLGLLHYCIEFGILICSIQLKNSLIKRIALILTAFGFASSLYFVFLQLFIIGAICLYCMTSAIISIVLFIIALFVFERERKEIAAAILHFAYVHFIKPILFKINPETVHESMTSFGELLGKFNWMKRLISYFLKYENPILNQTIAGIEFKNPIGLAAGFDYEAKITQISSSISFGFQSIGTITNKPYEGNEKPMLGRLPKSKSLMVNKGFKNLGAKKTIRKLQSINTKGRIERHSELDSESPSVPLFPIGISIGKTNTLTIRTQTKAIKDIAQSFQLFEQSTVNHSYYELNISCPNLKGTITFYTSKNLEQLLQAVDKLKLKRPLFIKMPIEKTDKEIIQMLEVIKKHNVTGIIIGNLQKDRNNPALQPDEAAQFPIGNFSGKPCFERSNHLIELVYKHSLNLQFKKYHKRFTIIGCGGVFSAEDAYLKIKLGASLVQLITGMIFEGPQLIADINLRLPELLEKDGFKNISEAVGTQKITTN
jgi:dihydroorotate dehydrogenase